MTFLKVLGNVNKITEPSHHLNNMFGGFISFFCNLIHLLNKNLIEKKYFASIYAAHCIKDIIKRLLCFCSNLLSLQIYAGLVWDLRHLGHQYIVSPLPYTTSKSISSL